MPEHYKEILKGIAENPGLYLWYAGCMIGQAEDLVVRTPMVVKLLALAEVAMPNEAKQETQCVR